MFKPFFVLDCSVLLKNLSQEKNKIVLNLKSNKELTSKISTSSNTKEILKDNFKIIESTKIERISNTDDATKHPSEILQTTYENNDGIKKQSETSSETAGATEQQSENISKILQEISENNDNKNQPGTEMKSDILRTTPGVEEIFSYTKCKEEQAFSQKNKQDNNTSGIQLNYDKDRHELLECPKRNLDVINGVYDCEKSFQMLQRKVYTPENDYSIPDDQKNLICDYCGHKGHSVYYCCTLVKVLNKFGKSNTPQIESNGSRVMICDYCGKNGHLKSYCRTLLAEMFKIVIGNKNSEKLLRTTEDGNAILLCDFCKKSVHLKRHCPKLKRELFTLASKKRTTNWTSEISGPSGQQKTSCEKTSCELAITCSYCRKKGHKLEDCLKQKIDKSRIFINCETGCVIETATYQ